VAVISAVLHNSPVIRIGDILKYRSRW